MKTQRAVRPPRLATALLTLFLTSGLADLAFLGDLEELWRERRDRGPLRADIWYFTQALGAVVRLFPRRLRRSLDGWRFQLRHALRRLLRDPLLTGVSVLTMGIGIGSTTAIYSVVDGVLLQPLPFPDPERLVGIWLTAPGLGYDLVNQPPALHYAYEAGNRSFEGMGIWNDTEVTVTGVSEPEQVPAIRTTWRTLPILGVQPMLGRSFREVEDTPEGSPTVVLAYGYWRDRLGSDPGVLGRILTVDGTRREIIGVLPRGFSFPGSDPDIFIPQAFDQGRVAMGPFSYRSLGRLRPGVTMAQALADLERLIPPALERYPGPFTPAMAVEAGMAPILHPLKDDVVGTGRARTVQSGAGFDIGRMLLVVLGAVGIVLLIACANVANLLLVRAERRQREFALRAAIGGSRGQMVGETLLEGLILGVAGGLVGLGLAYAGVGSLVAWSPGSLPRIQGMGVNGSVLALSLVLSLLSGMAVGVLPALRVGRRGLGRGLAEGGRGSSASRGQHLTRQGLVMVQVALAMVLLAGSGLMVRSFLVLRNVDPGFTNPLEVVTFRVSIPQGEEGDEAAVAAGFQEMLRRVRALPGVSSAALASSVTLGRQGGRNAPMEVEGFPQEADQIPPVRRVKFISEEYTQTMGNPLLAGRAITKEDVDLRAPVVVITEDLTREYWSDPADAVGARIRPFESQASRPWREIVGVVGNIRDDGVGQPTVPTVFVPQVTEGFFEEGLRSPRSMDFVVRTERGDPMLLLPQLQEAVWSVNPRLPLAQVRTLASLASSSMAPISFALLLLGLAAGIALFLGLVGIYGVVSYVVFLRTREIGLRIAVGADPGEVRRMVLRQGAVLAGFGVLTGLGSSVALTRLMSSLLYGVSPQDPLTLATVSVCLSLVVLVASWVPARRASLVDPIVALRAE